MKESQEVNLTKKELLDMYYYLKLTRSLENRIKILYRQGKIVGGVYLSTGQEAISIGTTFALEKDDIICPSHRDMGAFLLRGVDPKRIVAQYLGRSAGITKGKDGNVHLGDINLGIIGFVSMLADNIPVGVGIALTFQMRGEKRVAMAFFGEGATSRGDFHEGLNFAGIWKLPIVFICNNNQYAYSTPLELQMPVKNVADRASAYGFEGKIVDGNDVLAVYKAAEEAVDKARAGGGPTLIECKTFRMTGHAEHDDAFYVPKEKFEEWKQKDPLMIFESHLNDEGFLIEDVKRDIEDRIEQIIDEAVDFAERSPYPKGEETLEGVYSTFIDESGK